MKAEIVNNTANGAKYHLQYHKNLYLVHEKIIKIGIETFFHNYYLFGCNSRFLLFKILLYLLIEIFS